LRAAILKRNAPLGEDPEPVAISEKDLVKAARASESFTAEFADFFGVAGETASRIVGDTSAQSLALAIKGANLSRAAFSALVLLVCPGKPADIEARLSAFESVDERAATAMLAYWRGRNHAHAQAA
jgi:hypothetical protein